MLIMRIMVGGRFVENIHLAPRWGREEVYELVSDIFYGVRLRLPRHYESG